MNIVLLHTAKHWVHGTFTLLKKNSEVERIPRSLDDHGQAGSVGDTRSLGTRPGGPPAVQFLHWTHNLHDESSSHLRIAFS